MGCQGKPVVEYNIILPHSSGVMLITSPMVVAVTGDIVFLA